MLIAAFVFVCSGCQSTFLPMLLSAPAGIVDAAAQHNEEEILAYTQNQWVQAQCHFDAAIAAAPHLAEAHYNLGKILYKLNAFKAGDVHFIEGTNLAPGHKVIWVSPTLKHVTVPEKEPSGGSDGHSHGH